MSTVVAWIKEIAIMAAAFIAYALCGLAVVYWTGSPIAGVLGGAAGALLAWVVITRSRRGSLRPTAPLPRSWMFWVALAIAIAGVFLLGQTLALTLYTAIGSPGFDLASKSTGEASAALVLVSSLVAAPLGEEALMRGVVYAGLRHMWPPWAAAVVSSVAFALMHGNIVQAAASLPLALVLCALYELTGGRLWPVVLTHSVFNLASLIVAPALLAHDAAVFVMVYALIMVVISVSYMSTEASRTTS